MNQFAGFEAIEFPNLLSQGSFQALDESYVVELAVNLSSCLKFAPGLIDEEWHL